MTTPDHTLAARLADPNAIHINMLNGRIAKPSVTQIVHIYAGQLITTAEADARVEAAVLAGNAMVKQLDTMMLMLSGETAMTKPSLERALSGALDARNMWTDAIRSRGVTG